MWKIDATTDKKPHYLLYIGNAVKNVIAIWSTENSSSYFAVIDLHSILFFSVCSFHLHHKYAHYDVLYGIEINSHERVRLSDILVNFNDPEELVKRLFHTVTMMHANEHTYKRIHWHTSTLELNIQLHLYNLLASRQRQNYFWLAKMATA